MYVKTNKGVVIEYPYDPKTLKGENPNVSFPSEIPDNVLAEYGVYPVVTTSKPSTNIYEQVNEINPIFVNDEWIQEWEVIPARPPEFITRRQCALQLLAMQAITPAEALAMTKSAEVPAVISAIFDQAVANNTMTNEQRILVEIDFAATTYYRENNLLSLMGLTDLGIDQFFIAASQL